jgi:protein associated with RNAse G/E
MSLQSFKHEQSVNLSASTTAVMKRKNEIIVKENFQSLFTDVLCDALQSVFVATSV